MLGFLCATPCPVQICWGPVWVEVAEVERGGHRCPACAGVRDAKGGGMKGGGRAPAALKMSGITQRIP